MLRIITRSSIAAAGRRRPAHPDLADPPGVADARCSARVAAAGRRIPRQYQAISVDYRCCGSDKPRPGNRTANGATVRDSCHKDDTRRDTACIAWYRHYRGCARGYHHEYSRSTANMQSPMGRHECTDVTGTAVVLSRGNTNKTPRRWQRRSTHHAWRTTRTVTSAAWTAI